MILKKRAGPRCLTWFGSLIDYKACGAFERSQLVFISKIGPMVIKKIFSAWEEHVGSEMKLKN